VRPAGRTTDRTRDLASIHAAAAQLGMDTADKNPATEYRQLLARVGNGKTSAAAMTAQERQATVREFQRLLNRGGRRPKDGWHAELMRDLWRQLGEAGALQNSGEPGLLAFVKRMTKRDHLRFVNASEGNQVVEALKAWLTRSTAKGKP
jgi:hypothetical protein